MDSREQIAYYYAARDGFQQVGSVQQVVLQPQLPSSILLPQQQVLHRS